MVGILSERGTMEDIFQSEELFVTEVCMKHFCLVAGGGLGEVETSVIQVERPQTLETEMEQMRREHLMLECRPNT